MLAVTVKTSVTALWRADLPIVQSVGKAKNIDVTAVGITTN